MSRSTLRHAQAERLSPLISCDLVSDELQRQQDRLFDRVTNSALPRDRSLDRFDFDFNKKMNRALLHELATAASSASVRTPSSRPPAPATAI